MNQAEIERLSARIAELHECLTKCAESAYAAGVADERERCAKLCESMGPVLCDSYGDGAECIATADACAAAIRGA